MASRPLRKSGSDASPKFVHDRFFYSSSDFVDGDFRGYCEADALEERVVPREKVK